VPDLPSREVIREHHFERDLHALLADWREADAFVQAAEYVLARDPASGLQLVGDVWFLPMAPISGVEIALYYMFDDATVWLISIQSLA